ncbi:MAG TPA: hypothetical protein VGN44_19510 [Candidatus Angelobacter sp.]|jgi:hypothetical protein
MPAGYSGTPLIQKIGIKPGHRIVLRNHPASFLKDLGQFPEGVQSSERLTGKANVVVYFTDRAAELAKDFPGSPSPWFPMAWCGSAGPRKPAAAQRT